MPRRVLVTGGARGLGLAISKKFLENGDIVYINYNESEEQASQLVNLYPQAHKIKCNLTNETEIINLINEIKKEAQGLDILINNAGIAIDTPVEIKTKNDFLKILDTNLIAPFLLAKYASLIMPKDSTIINISSTNGIDTNYPYSLDYDASKAGLISLTHNLAEYLAPNIRVNCVAPGWLNTDMNKNLTPEYKESKCQKIMLNRFGEPNEIANVVFFLASNEASYINNSIIRVDGGTR